MKVHIPGRLKEFIERAVRIGHYPDEDAVIADALERLADEENDTRMTVEEAVAEARSQVARGETVPWTEDFFQKSRERAIENSRKGIPVSDDVRY
jgi:Arc/MetJ-type ribon-helix-helix transcriptional regulator